MRRPLMNTKHTNGCQNATCNFFQRKIFKFSLFGLICLTVLTSSKCTGSERKRTNKDKDSMLVDSIRSVNVYDIYVENSGSLKGYFNGNSTAKVILKEYYDRIDENLEDGDTITLNYINDRVQPIKEPISNYLSSISQNCNAQYSKIDDILSQAINTANNNQVQIVISDYCFTSNSGDFRTAQSGITSIFSQKIKKHNNFSVIIKKYDCDFKGKYYPGGIQYNGQRPLYIWIMGDNSSLKGVLDLDIKENSETICLQKKQSITPKIKAKKSRMIDKSDNSIYVKEWDAERDGTCYKLNFELDLSKLLINKKMVLDIMNYDISNGYTIEDIKCIKDDIYSFNITTLKPSPGILELKYSQEIPSWVSLSDFQGTGIPKPNQTLGIKALICGAYDAFNPPKGNSIIFSSSITIK